MKSLDVRFTEPRTVALQESQVPEPAAGQVRCRALTSLISTGTESFCLEGNFDPGTFWQEWVQYPFAPGYSMTSVVVDVGSGVAGLHVGDRVATTTPHSSAFLVDASECVVVPDSVSNEQASWTSLACTTQLGVRRAQLQLGESAAVVGLGALGQLVVQYLRLCGARRIIAIDQADSRLQLAQGGGATDLVAEDVLTATETLKHITLGAMVDVAFEITGHPKVLAPTTQLVRQLGRVVLLGDTPIPSSQTLGPRVVADSVSILGVHASSAPEVASANDPWTLRAMTELYFDFVSTKRMNVDSLITHRFTPDQAVEVYESLRVDRSGFLGVILDWTAVEV
ncbi:MAG TPA: zinc-binding alcohol dehydrogenase [Actinomycetes bacterium]|nr:zinc-binding alcohol dehydrogenase [Actinomycetes bacterium]